MERVRGGLTEIYQSLDFTEGILRMKYYRADTADKILKNEYWDKSLQSEYIHKIKYFREGVQRLRVCRVATEDKI